MGLEPAPEGAEAGEASATARRRGRRDADARKDRVMLWSPPFDDANLSVVYESDSPMSSHRYSPDLSTLFINERDDGMVREYAVFLDDPETIYTLADYYADDFYANPGILVMEGGAVPTANRRRFRPGQNAGGGGTVQVSSDGEHVFFYGTQYDEDPLAVAPMSFMTECRSGPAKRNGYSRPKTTACPRASSRSWTSTRADSWSRGSRRRAWRSPTCGRAATCANSPRTSTTHPT